MRRGCFRHPHPSLHPVGGGTMIATADLSSRSLDRGASMHLDRDDAMRRQGVDTVKATRVDRVRESLADDILSGRLESGTRLDEVGLARRFEVSRTPVREALRELAAVGIGANPRPFGSVGRRFGDRPVDRDVRGGGRARSGLRAIVGTQNDLARALPPRRVASPLWGADAARRCRALSSSPTSIFTRPFVSAVTMPPSRT